MSGHRAQTRQRSASPARSHISRSVCDASTVFTDSMVWRRHCANSVSESGWIAAKTAKTDADFTENGTRKPHPDAKTLFALKEWVVNETQINGSESSKFRFRLATRRLAAEASNAGTSSRPGRARQLGSETQNGRIINRLSDIACPLATLAVVDAEIRQRLLQRAARLLGVAGAPLIEPVTLCGTMFCLGVTDGGIWHELQRHRIFEASWPLRAPCGCKHQGGPVVGVYGGHARRRSAKHGGRGTKDTWERGHLLTAQLAMDMPWSTLGGISQAIPPAYASYIGAQLRRWALGRSELAA